MWRLVISLAVALVLPSCTSETADETTTTAAVEEPSPASTAAESTSTTIEEVGPVDVCPRGLVWEPGSTYAAGCFFVPVSFEPLEPGWGSLGAGDDWVKIRWRDAGREGFPVRVALISFRSSDAPAEVLDRIDAVELISEVSERTAVVVGGAAGLAVDVEGDPEPGGELVSPDGSPCSPDFPVWFPRTYFGHPLLDGAGQDVVGVGACHVARIWAVQAGDLTVTLVGGTTDPDRHSEAVAKIEELLEVTSFGEGK